MTILAVLSIATFFVAMGVAIPVVVIYRTIVTVFAAATAVITLGVSFINSPRQWLQLVEQIFAAVLGCAVLLTLGSRITGTEVGNAIIKAWIVISIALAVWVIVNAIRKRRKTKSGE